MKFPGGEHHEGEKAEGKPGGTRARHAHCGRHFVMGSLLIRFPPYSGRWGKTSEETLAPLWFSILVSSNPLETSFPQSSPEALDSKPWRDKGSSDPTQSRWRSLGRIVFLSVPNTAVSGERAVRGQLLVALSP